MEEVEREEHIGQGLADASVEGLASHTPTDPRDNIAAHEAD